MIQLNSISLTFGIQEIFRQISCNFGRQKIGLVGRNGTGKSTLLKVITGEIKLDEGSISIERGTKIAYMPQEMVLESTKSVFDEAFSVFDEFLKLAEEQHQIEEQLQHAPENVEELLERYEIVQQRVAAFDKAAALAQTERILKGLGFSERQRNQAVAELSVGWKMRVVLAKLLLEEADFYLFDEPTNHLDIVAQEWFSEFLASARFGFLLVTHDRYFLDHSCELIFELERGKGTLYRGNFTTYIALKEQQRAVTQSAYHRQQKEIAQKKATIDRFRASVSRASMAQSMIKQLDRMELVEIEPPLPTIKITFPPPVRSGNIVLKAEDIKKTFEGRVIFDHINCEVMRGEKVAIVAANGVGKTTFFNVLTGKYPCEQGKITFGHNVEYAIFEQDQTRVLKPTNTVYEEVAQATPKATESTLRAFLGAFLFTGDEIKKKISVLSGGERNRVAMVKVLLQNANFLLLDEPTNHLDLYAKDILLQAMQRYEGTILFVSHDHDFVQKLATRILELTPQGMYSYQGNYESYLWAKKELEREEVPAASKPQPTKKNTPQETSTETSTQKGMLQLRKEQGSIEGKIAQLEKQIAALSEECAQFAYGTPRYHQITEKLASLQKELKEKEAQWESAQQRLLDAIK